MLYVYLYNLDMDVMCMTSMFKYNELMKNKFLHNYYCQIMTHEVCDVFLDMGKSFN